MTQNRSRQQGATLMIALIMLIMLTLFAVSAMNTSTTNLRVVGNMQAQAEALASSQSAIEAVISTTAFTTTPANAINNPCGGVANNLCTDLNGDGTPELRTVITPTPFCSQARPQKISELKLKANAEDLACVQGQAQGTFGVSGSSGTGDSLCGQSVWDITARTLAEGANTTNSPVNVTVTQGVAVRIKALDLATNCP
ncbi:MAG TPA: PilX N-terminal domain-containing pilus assembly protein [Usitatibacter sp.]|nr:PilX N-terminal domain-containing pilus assembly protein [Usitatibacter sp.]